MARRYYETTRYYESVFALKPTLTEEEVQRRLEDIRKVIKDKGGEIIEETDWGLKQLAYPVRKFNHGRYFIFRIVSSNPQLPNELDFYYKISDDIIRWLNFRTKGGKNNAK